VSVWRVFEAYGTAFMTMDYVGERTLSKYVKDSLAPLPFDRILGILQPIAEGLIELHRFGVLHWDLNPNHVIVRSDHESRLIDFGGTRRALRIEGVTIVVRNLEFAAVEQFGPRSMGGPPTDVYGLAATIYYAVTGRRPISVAERMIGETLPLPREL